MTNTINMTRTILLALLAILSFAPTLLGAEASMQVPRRQGYVGATLPIRLIIADAQQDSTPSMPSVPGLTIERLATPNVSTQVSSFNGVTTTRRTVEWTFLVGASTAGTYTIPEFTIEADGTEFRTTPIELTFVASEAEDLLRVAVTGDPEELYLGEATNLTLQIWIKPYRDLQYGTELSSRDMWNRIDLDSDWGPFTPAMNELKAQRQAPRGRMVTVPGEDDEQAIAYLYELQVEDWPDRIGSIDFDDVRISMQYPVSLTRSRGFFNSGLSIDETRPITTTPQSPAVTVLPLPTDGRPAWFNGAVGRFVFDVTASPTDVAVGDPITLTMRVTDRGRRPANLDLLQAPALDRMPELESGFRVPREQLGGTVEGASKIFTQTIRATGDTVTEIPALPFSYFDPTAGRYETSWSTPIPISVRPATNVSTSNVLAAGGPIQTKTDRLSNVSGGLLANYTGDRLLQDQSVKPSFGLLALLALPPLVFAGVVVTNQRRTRLRGDTGYARSRSAASTAQRRLDAATGSGELAEALIGYIADRFDQPEAGLTRHDVRRLLDEHGADEELMSEVDSILATCEQHQYAGTDARADEQLATAARTCLRTLQGARLR